MYRVKPKLDFVFPCYRILKKGLGEFDSIIECNELAVRKFIKEAQDSDSINQYVEQESKRYSVRVNIVDIEQMSVRTAQLYILSVYQQAEVFLRNFQCEHPDSSLWKTREDGESRLHWILTCLNKSSFIRNCSEIGQHRFELFEYYRLVRNHFIHNPVDLKSVDDKFNELNTFKHQISTEYKLAAPNSYCEQSFDDFVLYSRVVKHVAIELCRIGKPQDQGILIMLKNALQENDSIEKLKKLSNNPNRLSDVLCKQMKFYFNLDRKDCQYIINNAPLKILGQLKDEDES